ncbi:MAG: ABC transporter permease, partial [Mesorhizobium sp.]
MTVLSSAVEHVPTGRLQRGDLLHLARRHPLVVAGSGLLGLLIILALAA